MSRSLQSLAGIDFRSLALFRIGVGLMLWVDQIVALTNVRVFYSDAGLLPRSLLREHFTASPWMWSLHSLSGAVEWQALLMVVTLVAATAVVLGWRTRVALFIAWALACSLHVRNPTITYGGDVALRLLCFWGLFLPLDARWSLASRRSPDKPAGSFMSLATVGLLLQVASIYWFTAALKFGNAWTRDGTALYYVLMDDQFVLGLGHWLLGFPDLCVTLTGGVMALELIGPFIAFIPWHNAWWRMSVVVAFWLLHLGMFLSLRLGCFPFIMMIAWLPFVPGPVWDRLLGKDSPPSSTFVRPAVFPQLLAACAIIVCLLWNLSSLNPEHWDPLLPPWLKSITYVLRLDQRWTMFAPAPITRHGWFVLDAELADSSHVDLLRHGRPVSYEKPPNLSAEAPDWKWHKLLFNLAYEGWAPLRSRLGNDFASQWSHSQAPNKQVHSWSLVYISEETLPNYMVISPQRVEMAKGP